MKTAVLLCVLATTGVAQMRLITQPSHSPLVNFRIAFLAGSAADPKDKPGTAYLTAMMLAHGGTKQLTYQQVLEAMFPMAASVDVQVDKEMVTFSGSTHVDNLERYYALLRGTLLDPGWRDEDFSRVKEDAINFLRVNLRANNDEELAKELLEQDVFTGSPYAHYSVGTVASLRAISLDDVKKFYRSQYSQSNLFLGIAGGFSMDFLERMKKDFRALPEGGGFRPREQPMEIIRHNRAILIQKPNTRAVAISLGFPTLGTRGNPDYPALLVAASYLGQHRLSNGVLFQSMREQRGLNYGDYAYIEYFPRGMFELLPSPNLVRRYQTFQIWVRPVEPPHAAFALRLALYQLDKLYTNGISEDAFTRTRDFLMKYVGVLTETASAELGYAMDSVYYGIPDYRQYLKTALPKLTAAEVNRVIKRYLRRENLAIVAVAPDAAALKEALTGDAPTPVTYNSQKSEEILAEDKSVEKFPLHLRPEDVTIVPVEKVFE